MSQLCWGAAEARHVQLQSCKVQVRVQTQRVQKHVEGPGVKGCPGGLAWAQSWHVACCVVGVHGPSVDQELLPASNSELQRPIPGNTSQLNLAPVASRAPSESHAVMGHGMQESGASMRARAQLHKNPHSSQHSSQNKTPSPHSCRPQCHLRTKSGAQLKVFMVRAPGGTPCTRSGHLIQAHQPWHGSGCTPPCPPHTQSLSTRSPPSCPKVSALAPHAHI